MKRPLHPMLVTVILFIMLLGMDVTVMVLYKKVETALDGQANFYLRVALHPYVWLGLFVSVIQLYVWTRILHRAPLSLAYPVSSASYPLTMIAAVMVFHEHLRPVVWVGAGFVVLGVVMVGIASGAKESGVDSLPADATPLRGFHELP